MLGSVRTLAEDFDAEALSCDTSITAFIRTGTVDPDQQALIHIAACELILRTIGRHNIDIV